MFNKPEVPSNIYVSRAYSSTGEDLLEGFAGAVATYQVCSL